MLLSEDEIEACLGENVATRGMGITIMPLGGLDDPLTAVGGAVSQHDACRCLSSRLRDCWPT